MTVALADEARRNYRFEWVRVLDLKIDPTYHDPKRFNEIRARRIAANFDDGKVGVITVSMRDGHAWLVDGLHRVWAARQIGMTHLYAKVFFGQTQQREAEIFRGLSTGVPLSALSLWMTRRVEGDPIVHGVEEILARHGVRVTTQFGGTAMKPHIVRSVATLETAFRSDPADLESAVGLIREVWPESGRAFDGVPLRGITSFLYAYRRAPRKADEAKLRDRLLQVSPERVISEYRDQMAAAKGKYGTGGSGTSHSSPAAKHGLQSVLSWTPERRAILSIYNFKLSSRALPDLTLSDLRTLRVVQLDRGQS